MRVLILCLLVGACSSAPRRSGDSGPGDPTPDAGGMPPAPGVDAAAGPPYVDPPPGTPAAKLMGFPLDLDFGTVAMGSAVRSNAVTITNVGDAPSRPLEATLTPAPDLRLTSNCPRRQLRPGETCVVTAEFEPRSIGMSMASGSVDDGAGGAAPVTFMARGVGRVAPDAGPDVARPIPMGDAGPDVLRDTAAAVDLARDVGMDAVVVPRDVAPDIAAADDARD